MRASTVGSTVRSEIANAFARGSSPAIRHDIPAALGRYTLLALRGRGGMGSVYEARDPELDRRVAIKVLREDRSIDTDSLRREAQMLARLVHPNVATVHDVGVSDGQVFVVIQLVGGESIGRAFPAVPGGLPVLLAFSIVAASQRRC